MEINPDVCEVLRIHRKKNPVNQDVQNLRKRKISLDH